MTDGTGILTITGANFGPATANNTATATCRSHGDSTNTVSVACNVSSNTEIVCATPPGVGGGHAWVATVGSQASDPSDASGIDLTTAYRASAVFSVNAESQDNPGLATKGADVVTITGSNFGPAHTVGTIGYVASITASYYGSGANSNLNYLATDCVVAINYTALYCTSIGGIGANLSWRVTIDEVNATTNSVYTNAAAMSSYALATISTVKGESSAVNINALKTTGSERVIITGINFGPINTEVSVWYVNPALSGYAGRTYLPSSCEVQSPGHTSIQCYTQVSW